MLGVGEAEAAFEAQDNDVVEEGEGVAVAVTIGAVWMRSKESDMGPHDAIEMDAEGEDDAGEDAFGDFGSEEEAGSEREPGSDAIEAVGLPDAAHSAEVNQLRDGNDDNGSKNGVGKMMEERGKEEQGERDGGGGNDGGEAGTRATVPV